MNRHIAKHFRYPEIAQKKGIQGRVYDSVRDWKRWKY